MKKIGFLISFILIITGSLYVFALPPLLEIVIKAEIARKNIKIDNIGQIKIGLKDVHIHNLALSKAPVNIEISTINIKNSPIMLLINRKAKALEIISPQIYTDFEKTQGTQSTSTTLLTFFEHPHKNIAALLDTSILALHRLSPYITIQNIKFDGYTSQGLISVSGDSHISENQILASFSAVQKQLTFNAQIKGTLSNKIDITSYIDNINLDIEHYKIKRGTGKFIYRADKNNKRSTQNFTANAGLVKINALSLNNAQLTSDSKESEHKVYIKAQHSPAPTDNLQYWYNIVENQKTSFLQAQHIQASEIFNLYSPLSSHQKTADFNSLLSNLFIFPTDINIHNAPSRSGRHYNISLMPVKDIALTKLTVDTNHTNAPIVNVPPFVATSTQVKALAQYFLNANLYQFTGGAEIFGNFSIDPQRGIIHQTSHNKDPLTLRLKNASFKSDNAGATKLNGVIQLIQSGAALSNLSFAELYSHDLKLRDGRVQFSLSPTKGAPLKIHQIRSTLGSGTLTVNTDNMQRHHLTGKRINASSVPSVFWPENKKLTQLVDFSGVIQAAPDNSVSAQFKYEIPSTSDKSQRKIKNIDNAHEAYPYVKYLGSTAQ